MKEAWGNHLLENISIKVSDGYCIRNLKRPPFWSTQIRGCLEVFMYWEFYPKFVSCKADWFAIINSFNQITNKTAYVLVSLTAVFVSLRKRYVTRQRLLQGQGSEPRASVTCITQKREQFDDSIWYWGLKKTQTILNNIIYFHCSGSRPRYKDEICRKNFKHNKPFFLFLLLFQWVKFTQHFCWAQKNSKQSMEFQSLKSQMKILYFIVNQDEELRKL